MHKVACLSGSHCKSPETEEPEEAGRVWQWATRFPSTYIENETKCMLLVPKAVWLALVVTVAGNGLANDRILRLTALPGGE